MHLLEGFVLLARLCYWVLTADWVIPTLAAVFVVVVGVWVYLALTGRWDPRRVALRSLALAAKVDGLEDDYAATESLFHCAKDASDGQLMRVSGVIGGQVVLPVLPEGRVKCTTRPTRVAHNVLLSRGREYVEGEMGRPCPTLASLTLARRHFRQFLAKYHGIRNCDAKAALADYMRICFIPSQNDLDVAETLRDKEVRELIQLAALPQPH